MPFLTKLSKYVFVIQATSVPCERLFSAAGNVITSKRASLNPDNAEALLFCSLLMYSKCVARLLGRDMQAKVAQMACRL